MGRVGAKRVPREKLIPKLQRIIENIEQNPVFTKEVKPGSTILSRLFAGTVQFRVKAMWVVGSFAHGARLCGDLDLVAEIELVGGSRNNTGNAAICVRNGEPNVDVMIGRPEHNHTGMEFSGAILIWTPENRDWRRKVSTIPVFDGEVRRGRDIDRLPIDPKILGLSLEEAEKLLESLDTGFYEWDEVPYDALTLATDTWPEDVRKRLHYRSVGKESRVLRDYAIEYVLQQRPVRTDDLTGKARHWTLGGFEIFCAPTQEFSLRELDTNHTCSCIVVAPPKRTLSALWVVRRSARHPLSVSSRGESVT